MATVITYPAPAPGDTRRAYAIRLGLAAQTRGRMSADANAACDAAVVGGFVFADAAPKAPAAPAQPKAAAAPRAPKVEATPKVEHPPFDASAVRTWAKGQATLTVGDRGRLHPDVVAAYLSAHGSLPAPAVKVKAEPKVKPAPKVTQVVAERPNPRDHMPRRVQTQGTATFDGQTHVQDICNQCRKAVKWCPCVGGPTAFVTNLPLTLV